MDQFWCLILMLGMFTVIVPWRSIHGHTGAVFFLYISWGNSPKSVEFPPQRSLLFPAVKTISFDFPTVNLVSLILRVLDKTRHLRSFEIRLEFESDVPIRIRFESDVPIRKIRIGRTCSVPS